MHFKSIKKEEWDRALEQQLLSHAIFASVTNEFGQDYELIRNSDIGRICYNRPKPSTPLKTFFLPVKENVTADRGTEKPGIILGIPNCDIEALGLLDEIYLDPDFNDPFYRHRRENTLLISSDCLSIQEHCHCLSYGIKPYSSSIADLSVISLGDTIILRIISEKGENYAKELRGEELSHDNSLVLKIKQLNDSTEKLLHEADHLPDYKETGTLVQQAGNEIWQKYSAKCVSCGACTTICPTCTCFLLIDLPGFEKVKQMDACQYPGFERVAGGEDSLFGLHNRFRNRYMCKYVWKPARFRSSACTGCGRCIEACIGKINKNEIFRELAGKVK